MPNYRAISWGPIPILLLFAAACSDSGDSASDASADNDALVQHDGTGALPSTGKDATPDSVPTSGDGGQSDAVVVDREVVLGDDNGIPTLRLWSQPGSVVQTVFTPDPKLRPVKPRKVRFLAALAFSATLSFHADVGGSPGPSLGSKSITTLSWQAGRWVDFDVKSLGLTFDGPFWVQMTMTNLPHAMGDTPAQFVVYGSTSTTGTARYTHEPDFDNFTPNFDSLYRIVVTTSDTSTPQLGGDGDSCRWALDCESGFCLANKCTIACTGSATDECGLGRRCQAFSPPGLETKVCVTECDEGHPCAEGFCMGDDPVTQDEIKASGFCVKGGPRANNADCRTNYHTICASGYCSACDSDPLGCDSPGTCQAP